MTATIENKNHKTIKTPLWSLRVAGTLRKRSGIRHSPCGAEVGIGQNIEVLHGFQGKGVLLSLEVHRETIGVDPIDAQALQAAHGGFCKIFGIVDEIGHWDEWLQWIKR